MLQIIDRLSIEALNWIISDSLVAIQMQVSDLWFPSGTQSDLNLSESMIEWSSVEVIPRALLWQIAHRSAFSVAHELSELTRNKRLADINPKEPLICGNQSASVQREGSEEAQSLTRVRSDSERPDVEVLSTDSRLTSVSEHCIQCFAALNSCRVVSPSALLSILIAFNWSQDISVTASVTLSPTMSRTEDQSDRSDVTETQAVNGETTEDDLVVKWGFDDWTQLYKIAVKFFKGLQLWLAKPIDPIVWPNDRQWEQSVSSVVRHSQSTLRLYSSRKTLKLWPIESQAFRTSRYRW